MSALDTLPNDMARCLGQFYSGDDCPRATNCRRRLELTPRGPRTLVVWALCPDDGTFGGYIESADRLDGVSR